MTERMDYRDDSKDHTQTGKTRFRLTDMGGSILSFLFGRPKIGSRETTIKVDQGTEICSTYTVYRGFQKGHRTGDL